jgi:hypothetical protein
MGLNSHPPTMPQLHVASLRPKPQVLPDSTTTTTVTPDGMLRPTSDAALSGEALMAVLLTQT